MLQDSSIQLVITSKTKKAADDTVEILLLLFLTHGDARLSHIVQLCTLAHRLARVIAVGFLPVMYYSVVSYSQTC